MQTEEAVFPTCSEAESVGAGGGLGGEWTWSASNIQETAIDIDVFMNLTTIVPVPSTRL